MMECTTGLTDDEFDELLAWLREEGVEGYPPILGLSGSLRAALMYIRQNIVQAVIGEQLGVSQPTVPAGHQSDHGDDRPDSDGPSAHRGGGARGLRLSWWMAPSSPAWTGAGAAICGRSSTGARG